MKKSILLSLYVLSVLSLRSQTSPEIQNVAFFLQDGVEILDFAGPMEVFISAGFNVYTVAETRDPIKAMGVLTIIPDYAIDDAPDPDMIAFFGGGRASTVAQKDHIRPWVQKQVESADLRFSVCTGAFFFGEVGLLDGQTATTFHSAIPGLRKRFPDVNVRDDVRYVDNGSVITTAGISAGIDGALHVVSKIYGKAVAVNVLENMEYFGWEPEKGLILEGPFIQKIRENGMEKALKFADASTIIYKGELLNLGSDLAEKGRTAEAVAVFDYVAGKYPLTIHDCQMMRGAYAASGYELPPTEAEFFALLKDDQWSEAEELLATTRSEMPDWVIFGENKMNSLGYKYLYGDKDTETAIRLFQLNVLAYPASFNVYDSLGEAYFEAGMLQEATDNYEKSLELNPGNDNGRKMLEKIRQEKIVRNR